MAKKGTKPAHVTQQRAREEQWRRRISSEGPSVEGTMAGSATSYESAGAGSSGSVTSAPANDAGITTITFAPTSAAASTTTRPATVQRAAPSARQRVAGAPGTASPARSSSTSGATLAAQRRATAAARSAGNRIANTGLSLDDEMHYVRSDVRRLILLTAICVLVLILLFFVIPR